MASKIKNKSYRHSSTFYRKVNQLLADKNRVCNYFGEKKVNNSLRLETCNSSNNVIAPFVTTTEDKNVLKNNQLEPVCEIEKDIISAFGSSSDESDEENNCESQLSFCEQFANLCLTHKLTHSTVNDLIILLNANGFKLPRDSRTLLKTPPVIEVVPMGNGQFWYNGVKNCLHGSLSKLDTSTTSLSLVFNIDGLPPFRSSPLEFWPILFKIEEIPNLQPMVAAIYCGQTKPPLQEFLSHFVEEIQDILASGIALNGHNVKVNIKYFVCDTPARSFIKGTVGFNAAHGCIKCETVGEYDKNGRHMSYPNINCPLRTDESFRQKIDEDHHKEDTPLLALPIDLVQDIIIADSLHLLHLGIMRKCLYGWVNGSYNFRTKLSAQQINQMSNMLEECNTRRPNEIHRSIRNLKMLKFWKGAEFRTFLLYVGPVVLKHFLSRDAYQNFLTIFCATTIVSCKSYLEYIEVAEQLFKDYIEQFKRIYGRDAISSNVHNLCHVVNDVKKFGALPEISSYSFENYLGHLKSLLRTGHKPLPQIAKRVIEMSKLNCYTKEIPKSSFVANEDRSQKHNVCFRSKVFKTVSVSNGYKLSSDTKNCWFMTIDNNIVSMQHATYYQEKIHVYGTPIKTKHDFFYLPIRSSYLNIYKSDGKLGTPKLYPLNDIKCKLFVLKDGTDLVFLPLLHTMC